MLVSVVVTSYNYARYLPRALRSLLSQSLNKSQYEIIVVNDASTDETIEVMAPFLSEIKLINLTENVGLAEARNSGIRLALGQYVVFVDADDYVHRDLLQVQSLFLTENNRLDAVSVDYYKVNDFGDHLENVSALNEPIACGVMYRKDLLFEIGLYDKNFRAREEEEFNKRFTKKYTIYSIPLPLYRYRRHEDNLTNNREEMDRHKRMLDEKHPD